MRNRAFLLLVVISLLVPSGARASSGIVAQIVGGCGGSRHVRVRPCPVILNGPSGPIVTVGGSGTTWSSSTGPCTSGACVVSPVQSSTTEWMISPGAYCGIGYAKFDAYTAPPPSGHLIGQALLKVHNHYCPQ